MHLSLIIFVICLLAGLLCIGGFLWSAMEQKPKAIWLIGTGVVLLVGLAGLVLHIGGS